MKKQKYSLIILLFIFQNTSAQVNERLIELGKVYRQFVLRNNPSEKVLKDLEKFDTTELSFPAKFIRECVKEKNSVLTTQFLNRPSDKDLRYVYIIVHINYSNDNSPYL